MKRLLPILFFPLLLLAQQQVQIVSGVLTLNLSPGNNSFKVIIGQNVTSVVITNPTPGTLVTVNFAENATGGFTVAFGGNIANPCTVTTTANAVTICQFQYDASSNTWNGISGGGGGGLTQVATLPASCTPGGAPVNLSTAPFGVYACGPLANQWHSGNNVGYEDVINVTHPDFGSSISNPDNAVNFATVASAANALAYVSNGTPTFRGGTTATQLASTTTLTTGSISITANDTVMVLILNAHTGRTFTITDAGGSIYGAISPQFGCGSAFCQWYGTAATGGKAGTGTITITNSGTAELMGAVVADYFNVGSYGQQAIASSGSGTTPTNVNNFTTQDNNNIVVSGIGWFFAGASTCSASVGNLRGTDAGTSALQGICIIDNTSATPAVVTTTGTLSQSSTNWGLIPIELRSVTPNIPTVYFPAGTYNYSSGLAFNFPVTLRGEPGTYLCYMGTGNAVQLGPTTLTVNTYQLNWYTIDGMGFTCGGGMTNGIYAEPFVTAVDIRNSKFLNFGNAVAYDVAFANENYDTVLHNNWFYTYDNVQRNFVKYFSSDINSLARIQNNYFLCTNGLFGGTACGTPGVGIWVSGGGSMIIGNEIGWLNPAIMLEGAAGTNVIGNYFELANPGSTGPEIQFKGNAQGIHIIGNYANQHAAAFSFLGPSAGTDTLSGSTIRDNTLVSSLTSQPLVLMNNVTGQASNVASGNSCANIPCPFLHTLGGNIAQWNADLSGTCTMNGSTGCPVYSFLSTYNVAPKCTASWTGSGTLAGVIKTAVSTSALTITSSTSTDTAVVNWACNPDAQ